MSINIFLTRTKAIRFRHILIESLLDRLDEAIEASYEKVRCAKSSEDKEFLICIEEDQSGIVGDTYGLAFVAAQTGISSVLSDVLALNELIQGVGGGSRDFIEKNKDIMRFGSPYVLETDYSKIETINAVANYYKHHNEWTSWSRPKRKSQKETLAVVQAIGLTRGSTGNCNKGMEVIDCKHCGDLSEVLTEWEDSLHSLYTAAGKRLGLL